MQSPHDPTNALAYPSPLMSAHLSCPPSPLNVSSHPPHPPPSSLHDPAQHPLHLLHLKLRQSLMAKTEGGEISASLIDEGLGVGVVAKSPQLPPTPLSESPSVCCESHHHETDSGESTPKPSLEILHEQRAMAQGEQQHEEERPDSEERMQSNLKRRAGDEYEYESGVRHSRKRKTGKPVRAIKRPFEESEREHEGDLF
jgi:hypothetical protein